MDDLSGTSRITQAELEDAVGAVAVTSVSTEDLLSTFSEAKKSMLD